MTHIPTPPATLLALSILLATGARTFARSTPATAPTEAASVSTALTATIHAVDLPGHNLEVLTGVGMALRVVHIAWDEKSAIRSGAGTAAATALRPGELVRVEYRRSPAGNHATTIEVLAQ